MVLRKRKLFIITLLAMLLLPFFSLANPLQVHAQETQWGEEEIIEGVPTPEETVSAPVSSPSECGTKTQDIGGGRTIKATPKNCLFLEEPIGGKPNYDLYIVTCVAKDCKYELWGGGYIPPTARGPVQAVLTYEPGKEYQGPFGLLYNYLGLIYAYMSGLIVGIAVLFVVVGGVQMSTSYGNTEKFNEGKSRIKKAIIGIILWFTASLILYTINPTFFAF